MASSVSATNSRLSVDDWVREGFRVLAEDGVKALTLGHLCTGLGVTKGSFYWHFSDMTAYRNALIHTWAVVRDEDRSFDALAAQPPRERLSRMMTALVGPRQELTASSQRFSKGSEATAFRRTDWVGLTMRSHRGLSCPTSARLAPRGVRLPRRRAVARHPNRRLQGGLVSVVPHETELAIPQGERRMTREKTRGKT